ncbi:hypothetical protein L1987_45722 [Smallanthus sonchifolius]|uniref:Uncharacterized protein n=1 Tax=Smallanthus sonchifolius TaxID=185202 RepID=A0ACB9FZF7_9ASTR|nr:hypothetical protein L1987_45722 [Smallanthus sonchifolius]
MVWKCRVSQNDVVNDNNEAVNVPIFDLEVLNDTPDEVVDNVNVFSPQTVNIRTPSPANHEQRQHSPPPSTSETMPSWAIVLKNQNEAFQPSYKNFRVSSSSSFLDEARRRQGENREEVEHEGAHDDADYDEGKNIVVEDDISSQIPLTPIDDHMDINKAKIEKEVVKEVEKEVVKEPEVENFEIENPEIVNIEDEEIKSLLKYIKEKNLEVSDMGNIRSLRFVVKKHKAYQAQLSKDFFIIRRTKGKCQYFKDGYEQMELPMLDLKNLAKINLYNPCAFYRGNDFESYLRKHAKDNFKSIQKPVKKRVTYAYSDKGVTKLEDPLLPLESSQPRQTSERPCFVLPQYNDRRIRNTSSLQPFTKMYVFAVNELKWLTRENLYALARMEILHDPQNQSEVDFCYKCIKNLLLKGTR